MNADLRHVLPADEVTRWHDIADAHGQRPPAQLLSSLQPDLSDLADLTRDYPRERDLSLIASRLCGLTGALHTDLGNDRQASDWLHTAARHAALSGDTAQQYWVATAQAMSALYGPRPDQVITIVSRTRAELPSHPCAPAAQLAGLTARAHAKAGRPAGGCPLVVILAHRGWCWSARRQRRAPSRERYRGQEQRETL
jgi:hypothetical protein